MTGSPLFVMIYDVVADDRRDHLRRLLREFGVAVQKSAFEARLTAAERRILLEQVARILDPSEDSFILYGVPHDQEERIAVVGPARPPVESPAYFIV